MHQGTSLLTNFFCRYHPTNLLMLTLCYLGKRHPTTTSLNVTSWVSKSQTEELVLEIQNTPKLNKRSPASTLSHYGNVQIIKKHPLEQMNSGINFHVSQVLEISFTEPKTCYWPHISVESCVCVCVAVCHCHSVRKRPPVCI